MKKIDYLRTSLPGMMEKSTKPPKVMITNISCCGAENMNRTFSVRAKDASTAIAKLFLRGNLKKKWTVKIQDQIVHSVQSDLGQFFPQ